MQTPPATLFCSEIVNADDISRAVAEEHEARSKELDASCAEAFGDFAGAVAGGGQADPPLSILISSEPVSSMFGHSIRRAYTDTTRIPSSFAEWKDMFEQTVETLDRKRALEYVSEARSRVLCVIGVMTEGCGKEYVELLSKKLFINEDLPPPPGCVFAHVLKASLAESMDKIKDAHTRLAQVRREGDSRLIQTWETIIKVYKNEHMKLLLTPRVYDRRRFERPPRMSGIYELYQDLSMQDLLMVYMYVETNRRMNKLRRVDAEYEELCQSWRAIDAKRRRTG